MKEVTSSKIIDKKSGRFDPNGLFSERIFGPVRDYTCFCGYKPNMKGETCPWCGVDIVQSIERRKRFAKIVLPMKVVNPLMREVVSFRSKKIGSMIKQLTTDENSFLYENKDGELFVEKTGLEDDKIIKKYDKLYDSLIELVRRYAESGGKKWKYILDNIDKLLINEIIVIPPDLRPITKCNDVLYLDDINRYYIKLLIKNEVTEKSNIDLNQFDRKVWFQYFRSFQKIVDGLYTKILDNLSRKEGVIRGSILGKRIDFSGRAVIVPDPTLKLDECSLPYVMFMELFKLHISRELVNRNYFMFVGSALNYVEACIKKKDRSLYPICEYIAQKEYCLLNRQPSLHRLSLLGFKIKINFENVIKIHPLVCPCFNADFDGDQMAVYIPLSEKAKKEVEDKFIITKNLHSPANGKLTTTPSQDIVLGIFLLSQGKIEGTDSIVSFKNKNVHEYTKIINECFPDDYDLVTGTIDKKRLLNILNDIKDKYQPNVVRDVLDKIKEVGLRYSTIFGCTMSLDKFSNQSLKELANDIYSSSDSFKRIQSEEINDKLRECFEYSYFVESGSRGEWNQVKQIILSRGYVSNFKGRIIDEPIRSSLVDGLNRKEFFLSSYGCRKGLLDVALNTAISGYLSRKLIFSSINCCLGNKSDCGTKDFLNVEVNSAKKAEMLIYRYYLDDNNELKLITKDNYRSIIGKKIKIRSPIFCRDENICDKCYGEYRKIMNSRFIGTIAAQSLGERSTQLVLRTFHTSGVAKGKDKDSRKQDDIVTDLSAAISIFHQKNNLSYEEIISELFEIYNKNGSIFHVHFEILVSQLMWKGYKKWRLCNNRDINDYELYSIQKVPSYESWILGLGFSNPKLHIIKGLSKESGSYFGIIDMILMGRLKI